MDSFPAPPTAAIAGHPLHATLVPFPIVCFTLALVTDVLYSRTANMMWQNFSAWLLFAGLVVGGFAALFGLIDLLARGSVRRRRGAWVHGIGNLVVLVLAFFNNLVHAADGWTAVVPDGLVLSAATVLVLIATVWLGRAMVFRDAIGVSRHD
ncbi:MAG: DUF2231 domain-containing protein [Amaricoccus sp.]